MLRTDQRVGEYILDRRIGAGAFGEVWQGHHHVWTDQLVAVKIPIDPQYIRSLQREGVTVHKLTHQNIVRAVGFDPFSEIPYLAMEYVDGSNLRSMIQSGRVAPPYASMILRQVLSGLKHAHEHGIIHRDIKPENILLERQAMGEGFVREGAVKLTDFGLGQMTSDTILRSIAISSSMEGEQARKVVGTVEYMSPEQRSGEQVDARADLYACGIVLYEMLTGERPAGTEMPGDIVKGVPSVLNQAFARSYARLDKRFGSADEFIAALDQMGFPAASDGAVQGVSYAVSAGVAGVGGREHLKACPGCRHRVGAEDQFCMNCGMQLVEHVRRCGHCGAYPDSRDTYCVFCGHNLDVEA